MDCASEHPHSTTQSCASGYASSTSTRKGILFDYQDFLEPTEDDKILQMISMFPDAVEGNIRKTLRENEGCVENAIDEVLMEVPPFTRSENTNSLVFSTLQEALRYKKLKFNSEHKRLKIHHDDVFTDVITHYKDPAFDALCPLKIQYIGQPAADTGGVLIQCYTDAFNDFLEKWFCRNYNIYLPVYRSDVYVTKVFVYLGRMLAHSISQGGPGLPVFPHSVYQFLLSGDTTDAIPHLSVESMGNLGKYQIALEASNTVKPLKM